MLSGVKFIVDGLNDIDDPGDGKPYIRITDDNGTYMETGKGVRFSKRSVGKFKFSSDNELVFHGYFPPFNVQVFFEEDGMSSCYDGFGRMDELVDEVFLCELMMDGDDSMPVGEVMGRYKIISAGTPVESATDGFTVAGVIGDTNGDLIMQEHSEKTAGDGDSDNVDDIMMRELPPDSTQRSGSIVSEVKTPVETLSSVPTPVDVTVGVPHPTVPGQSNLSAQQSENGDSDNVDDIMMRELPPDSTQASGSIVSEVKTPVKTLSSVPAPVDATVGVPHPTVLGPSNLSAQQSAKLALKAPKAPKASPPSQLLSSVAIAKKEPDKLLPSWANEVSIDELRGSLIEHVRKDLRTVGDLKMQLLINNVTIFNRSNGSAQQSDTAGTDEGSIAVSIQAFPKHESLSTKSLVLKSGDKRHTSSSPAGSISVYNFAGIGKPYSIMLSSGFVRSKLFIQGNFPWLQLTVSGINCGRDNRGDCLYGGLYIPSLRFLHADSVALADSWSSTVDILVASPLFGESGSIASAGSTQCCAVISVTIRIPLSCKIYSNKLPSIPKSVSSSCVVGANAMTVLNISLYGIFSSVDSLAAFISANGSQEISMSIRTRLMSSGSCCTSANTSVLCESFSCGISFKSTAEENSCLVLAIPTNFALIVNGIIELLFVPTGANTPSFVGYMSLLALLATSQSSTLTNTGAFSGVKKSRAQPETTSPPSTPWKKFACPLVQRTALSNEDISFPSTGISAALVPFSDSLTDFTLVGQIQLEEKTATDASAIGEINQLRDRMIEQRDHSLTLPDTQQSQKQDQNGLLQTQTKLRSFVLEETVDRNSPLLLSATSGKHFSATAPVNTSSVSGLLHCYVKGFISNDPSASLTEVIALLSSSSSQHELISPTNSADKDTTGSLTALNHMCKSQIVSWSLAESTPSCMSFDCEISTSEVDAGAGSSREIHTQACIGMLDVAPVIISHSIHSKNTENVQPFSLYIPLLTSSGNHSHCHSTSKSLRTHHPNVTSNDRGSDNGNVIAYLLVGVLFQKLSVSELIQYSTKKHLKSADKTCVQNVRRRVDDSWNNLIQEYSNAARGIGSQSANSYVPLSIALDSTTSCDKILCSGGLFSTRDYETLFNLAAAAVGMDMSADGMTVADRQYVLRFRSYALNSKNRSLVSTQEIVGHFDAVNCLVWNSQNVSTELYQSPSSALTTTICVQLLSGSINSKSALQCLAQAHVALSLQDLEMGLPITMTIPLRSAGKGSGGSKLVTLSLCFYSPSGEKIEAKSRDGFVGETSTATVSEPAVPLTLRLDIVDGYIAGMDTIRRCPYFEFAFMERGYFRALGEMSSEDDDLTDKLSLSDVINTALRTGNILTHRTPFLSPTDITAATTGGDAKFPLGHNGQADIDDGQNGDMSQHVAMGLQDFGTVMTFVNNKERQWSGVFTIINDVESSIFQQFGGDYGGNGNAVVPQLDLLILCRDASLPNCPIVGYNVLPLEDIQFANDRVTVWRHLRSIEDSENGASTIDAPDGDAVSSKVIGGRGEASEMDGAVSRANLLEQFDDFSDQNQNQNQDSSPLDFHYADATGTRFVSNGLTRGDELGSIKLAMRMFTGGVPLPMPDAVTSVDRSKPGYSAISTSQMTPSSVSNSAPIQWPNNGIGCVKLTFYSVIEMILSNVKGNAFKSKSDSRSAVPVVSPAHHIDNSVNTQVRRKMQLELDDADALELALDSVQVTILSSSDTMLNSNGDVPVVFEFKKNQFSCSDGENSIIFPIPTSNVILSLTVLTDRYKNYYTAEIDLQQDLLVNVASESRDDMDGAGRGIVFIERRLTENTVGANGVKKKRPLRVSKIQKLYLEASFIPFVKCVTKVDVNGLSMSSNSKAVRSKRKGEGTGLTATRFSIHHSSCFSYIADNSESGSRRETLLPELDTFTSYCGFEPFNRGSDFKLMNNYDNFLNMNISVSSLLPAVDGTKGGKRLPALMGEVKLCHLFWLALRRVVTGGAEADENIAGYDNVTIIGTSVLYRVCVDLFSPDMSGSKAGKIDLTVRMHVSQIPYAVVHALQTRPAGVVALPAEVTNKVDLLLRQAFVSADTDNSGTISTDELLAVFEKHHEHLAVDGVPETNDFGVVLKALSMLAPASFGANAGGSHVLSTKEIVQHIFSQIDIDGDGVVTWWEWMQILTRCLQGRSSNEPSKESGSPSAVNDAVILYLLAAAEKCKHVSKWKESSAVHCSNILFLPSYESLLDGREGGKNRSCVIAKRPRKLINADSTSKYGNQKLAHSNWIDPSVALTKDDASTGGVAKLHALITEMRSVNSTLAKKLETAILDGQKMNSASTTGLLSATAMGHTATGNFDRTLEGIDGATSTHNVDPLDVTSAALRKMRVAEQKSSEVEIALIKERNRVLELKYELETLRAAEEMNKASRTTKDSQYKSINTLKEREIAESKKRLAAIEFARQRKNTATFLIVTFLKTKAIPELRRRLFAKKYGYLNWWLTGQVIRWKYVRYLKLRQTSATKMSKLIRGGLTRKELRKQRQVVALLQRLARGHKQRGIFKKMKQDAKEKFELSVFNKQFDSACIIQRCVRSFLVHRRSMNEANRKKKDDDEEAKRRAMAAELQKAMHKSALALQRATRLYQSKVRDKKEEEARTKLALSTKCAILLQSVCRGRRDRIAARKIRLKEWYLNHTMSENLVCRSKPTVRQLVKWTRASADSYQEERRFAQMVNPIHRSDNACNGWWISTVFHADSMELVVDDDGDLPANDPIVVICNVYQYIAKSRLVRVFYYDMNKDKEVETYLPYDHNENTQWLLDKALVPALDVVPVQEVAAKERDPVILFPSRRPEINTLLTGPGSFYVYLSDGEPQSESNLATVRSGSLSHEQFKDHKSSVSVTASNFSQLEEKDIVILKIVDADLIKKNLTVLDFSARSEAAEILEVIPFKSPELLWFTDAEASVVHAPVYPSRSVSASTSKQNLDMSSVNANSRAQFVPIQPRIPHKPVFSECVGWKIKINVDDDEEEKEEEQYHDDDPVGVVVAADENTKQLQVSFDLEGNAGKDFVLYEEDLERLPYDSTDILWLESLVGTEGYVVPTIVRRTQTPPSAVKINDAEPKTDVDLLPKVESLPRALATDSAPTSTSSSKKPDFSDCVGWKIQVIAEDSEDPANSEDLFGLVVATKKASKQLLLSFDLEAAAGGVVAEEDLECVPYSSADIVWLQGGLAVPTIAYTDSSSAATKGDEKLLTKSASRDSKSSSASRLEALPAGTSALTIANELKKKVAATDENLYIPTEQLMAVCSDYCQFISSADIQHFKKLLVKPALGGCEGYLVRILDDTEQSGGETDILTDGSDLFGIVISSMNKKMIQVYFFHEPVVTAHTTAGIAGSSSDTGTGVDLRIGQPQASDEHQMVEVIPYNSKGVIWYKNVTQPLPESNA